MEAMVVAKKGVAAHPQSAAGHILLARIYAEQDKHKLALDEVQIALRLAPYDSAALRLAASVALKLKDPVGREYLERALAHRSGPLDGEAQALCDAWGVPPPDDKR